MSEWKNPVDHHIWIGGSDCGDVLTGCTCGVGLLDSSDSIDLGDLLTAVERHLQGRDVVTVVGELVTESAG